MVGTIITAALFIATPALVFFLCRRVPSLGKIGPIFILYLLGAVIGNTGILPQGHGEIQEALSNVCVPLSIPLLLMSSRINWKSSGKSLLAIGCGFLSALLAVILAYLILGKGMSTPEDPEAGIKLGAMMAGTYTGGTVNMASIQRMLDVDEGTFVIANTADMAVSFVYLMALLGFGIRIFRKILPKGEMEGTDSGEIGDNCIGGNKKGKGLRDGILSVALSGAIVGISYLAAKYLDTLSEQDTFMMIFILSVTTLGIAASYLGFPENKESGSTVGMYLIYIFSMVVSSMADFSQISVEGSARVVGFLSISVFGSLFIHTLLSKLMKIDADTMVITSVSLINSPPFVPVISEAMGNKKVMVTGLTAGIMGYALGNYLGIGIYNLLALL